MAILSQSTFLLLLVVILCVAALWRMLRWYQQKETTQQSVLARLREVTPITATEDRRWNTGNIGLDHAAEVTQGFYSQLLQHRCIDLLSAAKIYLESYHPSGELSCLVVEGMEAQNFESIEHCGTSIPSALSTELARIATEQLQRGKVEGSIVFCQDLPELRGVSAFGFGYLFIVGFANAKGSLGTVIWCVRERQDIALLRHAWSDLAVRAYLQGVLERQQCEREKSQAESGFREEALELLHDVKASAIRAQIHVNSLTTVSDTAEALQVELTEIFELAAMVLSDETQVAGVGHCATEELIESLQVRFEPLLRAENRRLVVRSVERATIQAAPHFCRRILSNFVYNSIRHANGDVSVEVEASDSFIKMRVRDQGKGLPGVAQGGLTADGVDRRFVRGHGIGLRSCQRLAKDLGGYTWYKPQNGGAEFGVALPRASTAHLLQESNANMSILLLEDDEQVLRMHERYLRDIGAMVITATSCAEARALLQRDTFDCLIADWHLADGVLDDQLLHTTAARSLVICSGSPLSESMVQALAGRSFQYIEKPTNRSELEQVISACIA